MAALKVKNNTEDGSNNQMALMQLRWQQMRQFEFQGHNTNRSEPPRRERLEALYSAA